MTGTEQMDQGSLLNEIGAPVRLSVGIANLFRTHTENLTDPNVQTIISHYNQET